MGRAMSTGPGILFTWVFNTSSVVDAFQSVIQDFYISCPLA